MTDTDTRETEETMFAGAPGEWAPRIGFEFTGPNMEGTYFKQAYGLTEALEDVNENEGVPVTDYGVADCRWTEATIENDAPTIRVELTR
jgi:hypothetical protein